VLAYIDEHFCENITNQSIASYFGYHPYYLNSLFHKTTGATIHGIILKKRMNKASLLLLTSNSPIAEISSACGFSSPSYFTEVFSGYYGVTPHIYKESAH
jgi:AraC-like DNA-binding protein